MIKCARAGFLQLKYSSSWKCYISTIAIVGAGQMGSGIAQAAAQTGHSVMLVDVSQSHLEKSLDNIKSSLQRVVKKKFPEDIDSGKELINSTLANLNVSTDIVEAVKSADIVIEAIVEQTEAKQKLFASLDKIAPSQTIFATNTSALSVQEIASTCSRKDRFGGLHFFNPVAVMKLVEVVRIPETSDGTFNALVKFGKKLGKQTVSCKDTPGFIVNRLLMPYNTEALKLLERGDATTEDIDTAMKLGAGYPMGPFELLDYTGLDTHLFIRTALQKRFPGDPLYYKSPIVEKLVSEGKLGVKTGEGFYKYNE